MNNNALPLSQPLWLKLLPHGIALVVSLLLTLFFFSPINDGKMLPQGDVEQALGMQTEVQQYLKKGEVIKWTNQAYIGMPTALVYNPQRSNWVANIANKIMFLGDTYDVSDPHFVFFWLVVFAYIGLVLFGVSPYIALIGAVSFALMSDNLILLKAGHCNKVQAIGFVLPVLGSAWQLLRGKLLWGGVAFAVFMSLQLSASHVQMVYYTFFLLGGMALSALFYHLRKQSLNTWTRAVGAMAAGVALGVMTNLTSLWTTFEYSAESLRGKSELSADFAAKNLGRETNSGMDKSAIFAWAHTKMETFTLFVPSFMGGSSSQLMYNEKGTETEKVFRQIAQSGVPEQFLQNLAYSTGRYWGRQAFTAGPIYYGVVLFFLMILGIVSMRSPLRWGLAGVLFFFVVLSWGADFAFFNNFMVDYFPFYNKFRDVKMTLVVGQGAAVVLACFALQRLWQQSKDDSQQPQAERNVVIATAIMAGLCLFALMYSMGGDLSKQNPSYAENLEEIRKQAPQAAELMERLESAMQVDRAALMQSDALKSLLLVLLAGGALWAASRRRFGITMPLGVVVVSGALLLDYMLVTPQYFNDKDFQPAKRGTKLPPVLEARADKERMKLYATPVTPADLTILADQDPHFRVVDFSRGMPQERAEASYFHKSLGGHHAAKPMLYDEFVKYYNFPMGLMEGKMHLLAMLNTKYLIQNKDMALPNAEALGNVWFVTELKQVANADEELVAIGNFFPRQTAIVQSRFADYLAGLENTPGANDKIYLTAYHPDKLTYKSETEGERFAVFSEIYYPPAKGWNVYVDGQLYDKGFIKVNYLLRGMRVPAGAHTIEMRFEPKSVSTGETIGLVASLLIFAALGFAGWQTYKGLKNA